MIPRWIICLFSLLLLSPLAHGQQQGTILFKISSPDLTHNSYILGSHHAFGKSFFDTLTAANEKLMLADVVIKENLDIPGHTSEEIINRRKESTDWSSYLNKKDQLFIDSLFQNSTTNFNKITTTEMNVVLNRLYTIQVCDTRSSSDPDLTMDDYIGEIASKNEQLLIGLETTEEQLEIIRKDVEGMPKKVHRKRIAKQIELMRDHTWSQTCKVTTAYREMRMDYYSNEPCMNNVLLTDRNNKWMNALTRSLNEYSCFIVVGLSHLQFECGLLNQLRDGGFIITPIDPY